MRLSEMVLRREHVLNCERRSQSWEEPDTHVVEPTELNRVHTEPDLLSQCQFLVRSQIIKLSIYNTHTDLLQYNTHTDLLQS